MTDHTWGVDRSHFDMFVSTAEIIAEGFGFMTFKAGGDRNDAKLPGWWADAKPHRAVQVLTDADGNPFLADADGNPGILPGAYWVLYPGHGAGAGDAFLARLDSQCPGWRDGPFILQLDCEEWGGDPGTMPHLADIRSCGTRLRALMPKLEPIVYAPHWAYKENLVGLGFPLWSSSYTTAQGAASVIYPGDSYSGWAPYSGIVPTIAQFSSTATVGGDTTTDVNCFKGTQVELANLLAPGWESKVATNLSPSDFDGIANRLLALGKQPDGSPTSPAGNAVFDQGIPNPFRPTLPAPHRTAAWQLLQDLGSAVLALQADVAVIKSNPAQVDIDALATATAAKIDGLSEATMKSLLEQVIRDIVVGGAPALAPSAPVYAEPGAEAPLFDATADEVTKRLRLERQRGIAGSGQ